MLIDFSWWLQVAQAQRGLSGLLGRAGSSGSGFSTVLRAARWGVIDRWDLCS